MSNEHLTDYQPGDAPVPVHTRVVYRGSTFEVVGHGQPREGTPDPETHYPDGVAYELHDVSLPKKPDSGGWAQQVRRRSFFRAEPQKPPQQ